MARKKAGSTYGKHQPQSIKKQPRYDPWKEDDIIDSLSPETAYNHDASILTTYTLIKRLKEHTIKTLGFDMANGYNQRYLLVELLRNKYLPTSKARLIFHNETPLLRYLYKLSQRGIIKYNTNKLWLNPNFLTTKLGKRLYTKK